jgi:hypothetical protein
MSHWQAQGLLTPSYTRANTDTVFERVKTRETSFEDVVVGGQGLTRAERTQEGKDMRLQVLPCMGEIKHYVTTRHWSASSEVAAEVDRKPEVGRLSLNNSLSVMIDPLIILLGVFHCCYTSSATSDNPLRPCCSTSS